VYGAIVAAMLTTTAPAAPEWWWQFEGFGCSPFDYLPCWYDPSWTYANSNYYWPYYWPTAHYAANAHPTARVVVKLPADARLFVENDPCPLTSAERSFDTPELQPGVTYSYTIRAEVTRDGQVVKESKRVTVRAGQETVVEFGESRLTATASR
jgi:uncharacterized protein (TIGR03000 family)